MIKKALNNISLIKLLITSIGCYCYLLLILSGCKKYEEGPKVSFRSAKNVILGNWRIEAYAVDGADSMWVIERLHLHGNFNFAPYDTYRDPDLGVRTIEDTNTYGYSGHWRYEKKDNEVTIALYNYKASVTSQSFNPDQMPFNAVKWKLVRLKHNEDMWVRADHNGKQYELRFKSN